MEITKEDVTEAMLELSKEGKVIGKCHRCQSYIGWDEISALRCSECRGKIDLQLVSWTAVDTMPKA